MIVVFHPLIGPTNRYQVVRALFSLRRLNSAVQLFAMELNFQRPIQSSAIHFLDSHADLARHLKEECAAKGACVLFDSGLGKVWKQRVIGFGVPEKRIFELPAGEQAKTWEEVGRAIQFLHLQNHERNTPIFVIGGGACLDAGALVASIYRRGVPLVLVPTTLLSMIDATVGGKTAVNLEINGTIHKNVAGTFYPASKIFYWSGWLESLGRRERLSGVGELLKTVWLNDSDVNVESLRDWIDGEVDESSLWNSVREAVAYKIKVVESDPLDTTGSRAVLNFGHTLGHALESLANGSVSHGEAVAWGMWAESLFVCADRSNFYEDIRVRIQALGFEPPEMIKRIEPGAIAACLYSDKKMSGGRVSVSALTDFGVVKSVRTPPHELAKFAAKAFQDL